MFLLIRFYVLMEKLYYINISKNPGHEDFITPDDKLKFVISSRTSNGIYVFDLDGSDEIELLGLIFDLHHT